MSRGESECSGLRTARRALLTGAMAILGLTFLSLGAPAWAQIDPPPGECNPSSPDPCPGDDNLCTIERCDPETLRCVSAPVTCTADDNLCTTESCNPENGQCGSRPVTCTADDNLCTTESCDPENGQCGSRPVVCPADDDLCTTEACVPETGECEPVPPAPCEEDEDPCTTGVCDPSTGECVLEPTNPPPDQCAGAICRTPGFWGTHAGTEKASSSNITQAVLDDFGPLTVCGKTISSTITWDDNSALEAICVPVSGTIRLQLARQLTAAALNCAVSDGAADCSATSLYSALFASCNAICANSTSTTASITRCVGDIDCLNNGGRLLANGYCQTGACAGDGTTPCKAGTTCLDSSACMPLEGNCHSQLLDGYEPTGPAGSSSACNSANKSSCTVVGSGLTKCTK